MSIPSAIESRLRILGAAIRAARQQRGWTQSTLAKRAGVPVVAIMKIEGGTPGTQIGYVLAICSALGISIDPNQHASTPAQERHLLELAAQRKRVRKPGVDPALDV
ncbi:MAG TPA: helix-turn-helix domain-containing protein [Solimonas sp.]|nr:helix-turn-helix domain-containing protein [Solimonas sp.]